MKVIHFQPNPKSEARVVGYLHDPVPAEMPSRVERPCVVVCPGGGYSFLSEREADPPAMAFFAKGYQVFVLYYSIGKMATELRPLIDGSLTLIEIRRNSAKWHVIPDKIAVMGFSAGGHVAASLGTLWDSLELKERIDNEGGANRPNALILCYAVITASELTHKRSIETLCGGHPTEKQKEFYSLEKHVDANTPPAFLWHTVEDGTVPVENSIMFAQALRKNHIPFECHIYQKGGHGTSMCNEEVGCKDVHRATWFPLCTEWLGSLFEFSY